MKKLLVGVLTGAVLFSSILPAVIYAQDSTEPSPTPGGIESPTPSPELDISPATSPNANPTDTATPTLTPTPEATATPTSTLTPTPTEKATPRHNRAPVIATDEMNPGMVGWPFTGIVLAVEFDDEDPVKLEVLDLPPGLLSAHCASITWNIPSFAYCFVLGVPTRPGVHHATVRATDSMGAVSEKKVKMSFYVGIPRPFDADATTPSVEQLKNALLESL